MQRRSLRLLAALFAASCLVVGSGCGGAEGSGPSDPAGTGGAPTGAGGDTSTAGVGGASSTGAAGGGSSTGGEGTGGSPVVKALVHRVGRLDDGDPQRPRASWSGTTFRTRVVGSGLSVKLGGSPGILFQIEVDGQSIGTFKTSGGDATYEVASGLPDGPHDVVLVRRNEGFFGDVAFLGFEPAPGATLAETPWPYSHTMELLGDSLTAGYGIEGASAGCSFSAATESFYGTYGAIAARNVGAAVNAIAYSGKGVFQNYAGDKNEVYPGLWLRTLTNDATSQWDFSQFTPEAVVINLGTNDFSAPIAKSDFEGAYVALLGQVREKYPAAMIFCVTWAHWGATHEAWVEEAMAATSDPDLRHLGFSIDPADGLGCDSHTNLVTNAKLGVVLTQALQSELGW